LKHLTGDVAKTAHGPDYPLRGRTRACLLALLVIIADSSSLAAQNAATATGRIEGVATLSRRLTTSRMKVRIYSEPGGRAPAAPAASHSLAGVIIYLEATPALRARTSSQTQVQPVMRQHGEKFAPHVLPVLAGTTVDFPNEDGIYHNVFSLSHAREFDLGRYPRGESKQVQFSKPGVVQVFCHIHSDMTAYVLVLDNPFFVIPDANGRFVLDGVPSGDYRLIAWHERIRPMVTLVRVDAGRVTSLSLHVPLPDKLPSQ
jgi:plastocyanin